MSFTLSIAGIPFLVDPGTYLYHSGGKWRYYFRSTAAHNTIQINDTEFTDMPADFMFGKPYKVTDHTLFKEEDSVVWLAGHNAYQNLDCAVNCNRRVVVTREEGPIVIEDSLAGVGEYSVKQFFHFHPDCQISLNQEEFTAVNKGVCLKMTFAAGMHTQLFFGSEDPLAGWFSKEFNHLEKTATIVVAGQAQDFTTLRTRLQITDRE